MTEDWRRPKRWLRRKTPVDRALRARNRYERALGGASELRLLKAKANLKQAEEQLRRAVVLDEAMQGSTKRLGPLLGNPGQARRLRSR